MTGTFQLTAAQRSIRCGKVCSTPAGQYKKCVQCTFKCTSDYSGVGGGPDGKGGLDWTGSLKITIFGSPPPLPMKKCISSYLIKFM